MGIMRFNFRSEAIGGYVDVSIVYPTDSFSYYDSTKGMRHHFTPMQKAKPCYKPGMKFQTVYLLHGGGDDDTLTYRYTNAELYAQRNNVMLVTPNIVNSFGVDTCYGVEYSKFITDELPVVVQSLFASSPKREDNFIVGYAMGGNAALGNALMRPDLYNTCIDMSGGIGLTLNMETLKAELESDHFKRFPIYLSTFGPTDKLVGSHHDLYKIAKDNIKNGVQTPKIYMILGSKEDFIKARFMADVAALKELKYDMTFINAEGYNHDFEMWDKYIALAFDELLPLKRQPIYQD